MQNGTPTLADYRKNYNVYQWTFMGLLVYALFFPLVSSACSAIHPAITTCYYKELTGEPCFFCGGTTAFRLWWSGQEALPFRFACVAVWWLVETLRRTALLVRSYSSRTWAPGKNTILWDVAVFCVLAAAGFLPVFLRME